MSRASHAVRQAAATSAALAVVATLLGAQAATATGPGRGSSWGVSATLDPALRGAGSSLEQVLVTAAGGAGAAGQAVRELGGRVVSSLPLVDGVAATVRGDRLDDLARTPGVVAVTKDRAASFEQISYDAADTASSFVTSSRADAAWTRGATGEGVGIAVLDTGVSAMPDFAGRLVHGPDLSGEGTTVDTFGHGTVMAGVAAGSGADSADAAGGAHTGVAPEATVVAVKVAGRDGAVDVSTILQGMHWVSTYREQYGIRVLNLSWGTDSTQSPALDPLNHAVQRLWQQGIVVVVAAGNSGPRAGTITKPADDPMVLTVGAYDDKGDRRPGNDTLSAFSSRGPTAAGHAKPDLVAPGRTLVAPRSFGSQVELDNPKALISPSYIKGSGTSHSAAVVSGLAALVLAEHPTWTPDQVKHVLTSTAAPLTSAPVGSSGRGRVRLDAALTADPGPAHWQVPTATGLGSLQESRGSTALEVVCPGDTEATPLKGEIDVRCERWDGSRWSGSRWSDEAWTGSRWSDEDWTGSRWSGDAWTGGTWSGSRWSDEAWTGSRWSDSAWSGSRWSGSRWSGSRWSGSRWSGSRWSSVAATTGRDDFLTAFWGQKPKAGLIVAGEVSDGQ